MTFDLIPSVASVFTLLFPEVKGGDPDLILAEEIRVRREARKAQNQETKEAYSALLTGGVLETAHRGNLEFGRVRNQIHFIVRPRATKATNEGANSETFLYNLAKCVMMNKFCSIVMRARRPEVSDTV